MELKLNKKFEPRHGELVPVAPGVWRLTAPNPSPFTFHGTNTYIVGGKGALAIIDPGPEDDTHLQALLRAIGKQPVSHIFVTHTHRDHSSLARKLSQLVGAPTAAEGPHRPARPLWNGETNHLDAGGDRDFRPDILLADGALVEGDGWALRALHTPGHAANHLAFGLEGTALTFSGDHVMAWSTTVVAPPDGAMADYIASLDRFIEREDGILLPGHGGPVFNPKQFLRGLKAHRKMRERAILDRLSAGDRTISDIVRVIYRNTDPRLHRAAALSVLAHLMDLVERGLVRVDGTATLKASYHLG
ncbi:MBL fold metallo-hydrolase [Chelativorans sp. Marseille-P2723]|uniref:MBL fold metallo-hydrolase n=1 Tax=Chelativorans sp. Marseille-P2723 TaxID=2709133 RepID=UPI00156F7C39|nr:MBL fold metallo-hydrolase [Chelativorans sp. Marseille-P2723]